MSCMSVSVLRDRLTLITEPFCKRQHFHWENSVGLLWWESLTLWMCWCFSGWWIRGVGSSLDFLICRNGNCSFRSASKCVIVWSLNTNKHRWLALWNIHTHTHRLLKWGSFSCVCFAFFVQCKFMFYLMFTQFLVTFTYSTCVHLAEDFLSKATVHRFYNSGAASAMLYHLNYIFKCVYCKIFVFIFPYYLLTPTV